MTATANGKWTYPKQEPTPGKQCIDCVVEFPNSKRPAPYPGPRCASHDRAKKRNRRLAAAVRRIEKTYGLTAEEYDALYAYQDGKCALCRRATGATKRLAVDHDHRQAVLDGHPHDTGCSSCVRGLLCSVCNDLVAHARDEAAFGQRLYAYLQLWPVKRMRARSPWPPTPRGV